MTTVLTNQKKPISHRLYGLFLEDINRACDGGLNADLICNPSFRSYKREAVKNKDYYLYRIFRKGKRKKMIAYREIEDSMYGWTFSGSYKVENGKPIFDIQEGDKLSNGGFDGIAIKQGKEYVLTFDKVGGTFDGKISVTFLDEEGKEATDVQTVESKEKQVLTFCGKKTAPTKMTLTFSGRGTLSFGRFSFYATDSVDFGGKNPYGGKMRRDLVEAMQNLHPSFLRFPGGCIVEGYSLKNAYRWKDTVGKLEERVPKFDLWGERRADSVYMQSYEIGFYEYFLLAEYLGAEPLPILNAGLACQGRCTQIATKEELEDFCQDFLDLIEYANGTEGVWAEKRKQSGHPEPFGLRMIGVGNENWGEKYTENFDYIYKKIRARYPDMEIVFTNGYHCYGIGKKDYEDSRKFFDGKYEKVISDEHFYRTPDWVVEHRNLYDDYDRNSYPVFLGEYAANSMQKGITEVNTYLSALTEAVFLTGLEKNADIVQMASYAPLLAKVGDMQWEHNLINFDGFSVLKTTNYHVQWLFTNHIGTTYIPTKEVEQGLFVSVTQDEKRTYVKVVNFDRTARTFTLNMTGTCEHIYMGCEKDTERNLLQKGVKTEKVAPISEETTFSGSVLLPARSIHVFTFANAKE